MQQQKDSARCGIEVVMDKEMCKTKIIINEPSNT